MSFAQVLIVDYPRAPRAYSSQVETPDGQKMRQSNLLHFYGEWKHLGDGKCAQSNGWRAFGLRRPHQSLD
jgi:hypothetical protein